MNTPLDEADTYWYIAGDSSNYDQGTSEVHELVVEG